MPRRKCGVKSLTALSVQSAATSQESRHAGLRACVGNNQLGYHSSSQTGTTRVMLMTHSRWPKRPQRKVKGIWANENVLGEGGAEWSPKVVAFLAATDKRVLAQPQPHIPKGQRRIRPGQRPESRQRRGNSPGNATESPHSTDCNPKSPIESPKCLHPPGSSRDPRVITFSADRHQIPETAEKLAAFSPNTRFTSARGVKRPRRSRSSRLPSDVVGRKKRPS